MCVPKISHKDIRWDDDAVVFSAHKCVLVLPLEISRVFILDTCLWWLFIFKCFSTLFFLFFYLYYVYLYFLLFWYSRPDFFGTLRINELTPSGKEKKKEGHKIETQNACEETLYKLRSRIIINSCSQRMSQQKKTKNKNKIADRISFLNEILLWV